MATHADKLLRDLKALLPTLVAEEPCDDGVRLTAGDPCEIVVQISGNEVHFSQFALEWEGSHEAVIRPLPIATIHWRTLLKKERTQTFKLLVEMIVKRRRKLYRVCQYCERLVPPESLHGEKTCHGCAERHLGVVH